MEHAASVAKTFLTSDAVVVEIKEPEPVAAGNPMDNSGFTVDQPKNITDWKMIFLLMNKIENLVRLRERKVN